MTSENGLEKVFDDVVYENNAQDGFHRLEDLDNQRDNLLSRWIWELVQNARGTAGSQNQLAIQVIYAGDELFFRHNGAPFRDREIAHLVLHGSSKRDPKDIGRYGTGFISTHLISRRVGVRGRLDDGRGFDFILNRDGKNADELRTSMERSRDNFLNSLKRQVPAVPDPYTTEYRYPVGDSVREVVGHGVTALRQAAPYLFAFNEMLCEISILDDRTGAVRFTREAPLRVAADMVRFGICVDGGGPSQWVVDAVRMSTRQVEEAVGHFDRYFLCAIAVPTGGDINVDFFKANARFVTDIGHRLERLWSEYISVQGVISDADRADEGVELEMSDQQVRFSVRREVWGSGSDFGMTLALLGERILIG